MDIEFESNVPLADPEITDVVDSSGNSLENPDTTEATELTLFGRGPESAVVLLFDNGAPIGSASVTMPGNTWTITPTQTLALGRHSFTVKISSGHESTPWVITVETIVVPPTISNVVDSRGEVLHEGTTFDTTVTVSGAGAAGKTVEFFQDGASKGEVSVDASGVWTHAVIGLTEKRHNFQVRARYGSHPVSNVRSLFAVAAALPTITRINDSSGTLIPEGGETFDPDVTVVGKAQPNEKVEVRTAYAPHGTSDVDSNGNWTFEFLDMSVEGYSITAKALYANSPVSPPYTYTLLRASAPTISSIKDDAGTEIPPDGPTFSSTVTLTGTAVAGQQVEIYDGTALKGTVPATSGTWTLTLRELAVKAYSFKARGLYGSNPESAVRTFSVVAPLTLPSHDMLLSGQAIKVRVLPTNASWPTSGRDFPGNTEMRTPTGGVPPYQYSSNLPNIASVSDSGKVTGSHNGEARITVIDRAGATASYTVRVSGVRLLVVNSTAMNSAECTAWLSAIGSARVMTTDVQLMASVYDWPPSGTANELWTTTVVEIPPLPSFAFSMILWPISENNSAPLDRRMPAMCLPFNW